MVSSDPAHFLIVGAGAAGLMAARELAAAGKQVTILEARDRCGGRIFPLPVEEFGYAAEGGAEFVHGAAPVTRAVMREAGLSLSSRGGTRWNARTGVLRHDEQELPHAGLFYRTLAEVTVDLPIAEFLAARFGAPEYAELRRRIIRTVEGYDAANPRRASTLALREEWTARDDGEHGRLKQGYAALIDHLVAECRRHGAMIHCGAVVTAIDEIGEGGKREGIAARCANGVGVPADAAILSMPLPLLSEIALPPPTREQAAAAEDIGYGNVVKLLFRFATKWWFTARGRDLSDLSFLLSDAAIPTWWSQYPTDHAVLTGWFAGPRADRVSSLSEVELVEMGLASLGEIFALPIDLIRRQLVAARAINWGNDPFARGAYSYATPRSRAAQSEMRRPDGPVFFAGEALYDGPDMGTVEAALANGLDTARSILARHPAR